MQVIKDLRIIKAIAKKYNLDFCRKYKYYVGDACKNNKGKSLPYTFEHKEKTYKLKYFDGCFNPFLVTKTN